MRVAVLSTMTGLPWGASEELWSRSAERLLERGHEVTVRMHGGWGSAPRLEALRARGARIDPRFRPWRRRAHEGLERVVRISASPRPSPHLQARLMRWRTSVVPWRRWLRREAPDLVLVSLGAHRDDPAPALACRDEGLPYALLLHSVDPERWIEAPELERFRRAWSGARRGFFVSAENRDLLADQLAIDLPASRVVANPLAVRPERPLPWPASGSATGPASGGDGGELHLACVGRLGCWQKGQDVVVETLARERWRARSLRVTFWGGDHGNRRQLEDLTRLHGLEARVTFAGHTSSPLDIWRRCHGLLLPSRYEGMPMVTAEAMFCGRVPVVTACGRNPEWVEDGATGFLAPAATPDLLDETLERAWGARARWPEIGRRAAERIRELYDPEPERTFADALEELA